MTPWSPANSRCQNAWLITAPGEPQPATSSPAAKVRPSAGFTPASEKKFALTNNPSAYRASPPADRLKRVALQDMTPVNASWRFRISSHSA
jgi:hypothetical protein